MKRMHLNISVSDIDRSVRFYSTLFGAEPTVRKPDYAKWMLEDPRVNFAISTHGTRKGLDHVGIQVESEEELDAVSRSLKAADVPMVEQGETTCCYAVSDKNWVFDPEGLAWETFYSLGDSTVYGAASDQATGQSACCDAPAAPAPEDTAAGACCDAPAAPASGKGACCN